MPQYCRSRSLFGIVLSLVILGVLGQGIAVAQVDWAKTFDGALKQAAREKKFFILDVSASW